MLILLDVTPEVANAVEAFWNDPGIRNTWALRSNFQIFDSAQYFFERVHNFETDSYVPTIIDVLRCRIRTSGIVEETFKIEDATFHVFDVGGESSTNLSSLVSGHQLPPTVAHYHQSGTNCHQWPLTAMTVPNFLV